MFFLMQAVALRMVEQGRGGKIINMASQAGRRGEALVSHYCATKAAVISYTQSAALALAKERINVNGIAPGVIDTPMWEQVDALFAKYENRPLGEKKRARGRGSAARTHGPARRPDGRGAVPRVAGFGLHHRSDTERRRRQLDELKRATARRGA